MLDYTLQELSDIVEKINNEIYEIIDGLDYIYAELKTDGDMVYINFLDIEIWSSEDDMRDFDDDNDCWEPMGGYLRRMINIHVENLSGIKL